MTTAIPHSIAHRPLRTVAPVPRWVVWTAHIVALTPVPSGLWRVALGLGVPVGFSGELAHQFAAPGWITLYVILLSLLAEAAALLVFGLVRPWGEVVPRWIPVLGGRPVPVLAAVLPAALGAVAVTAFGIVSAASWYGPENNGDPEAPQGLAGLVMTAAYAPMLLWGPLLAVVTAAYCLRRRRS